MQSPDQPEKNRNGFKTKDRLPNVSFEVPFLQPDTLEAVPNLDLYSLSGRCSSQLKSLSR